MLALRRPLLVLLAGLAACSSPPAPQPDPAPLRPEVRLADQGRSGAQAGAVPSAEIGGVRRPVLARSAAVALGTTRGAGDARSVAVQRPDGFGEAPLRLAVTGGAAPSRAPAVEPALLAAGVASAEVRVTGSEPPSDGDEITVTGRAAPAAVHATPVLTIPQAAVLRFAIGLDEQEWPDGLAAVAFRIVVAAEGGEEVVFERTIDPSDRAQRGWLDAEVDLARFAGLTASLRFETTAEPGRGGLFTFPVWGDPTVLMRATSAPRRPNFLLISLDTLRADHLGTYGYARPTTPTIDSRLAARGTVFERAYTSYPSTPGAHMTLFTALLTCVHGVDGLSLDNRLALDTTTLPELLRAAGYASAAFVENAWVTHTLGFARGFGTWVENTSPRVNAPIGQAEKTFAEAASWIDAHREQPWLVFAHTYQVHDPYAPPPGYLEQVAPEAGDSALEQEKARYDGEVRYTDDLLAKLLDALEDAGELRDTIVVLFSDHGEHFGEHGQHRHGFSLYDELLRVPLVVSGPGVPEGKRIAAEVGLIDVLPTVLDLAGVPTPPDRQGQSLTPLLRDGALAPRTLFAELPVLGLVAARRDGRKVLVDTKQRKAWTTDLRSDPREERATPSFDDPDTVAQLAEFERACATRGARPGFAPDAGPPAEAVDPAVQEKLRALGYTE